MQFKLAAITTVLAVLGAVAANPAHHNRIPRAPSAVPASQCQEGKSHCCGTIAMKDDNVLGSLLNTVGHVVDGVVGSLNGLVGIYCTPIDVLGITQSACKGEPVCCTDKHLNGVIVAGCSPINIHL